MSNDSAVRCLLIPIKGAQLLLPSAVIAEISPYKQHEELNNNSAKWLLGIINWRNQRVPLLSIEEALSLPMDSSHSKNRIVIVYGLELTQTMPFYAFLATDIPRTLTVTEESLNNNNAEIQRGSVFNVTIQDNETALLPDLTYLENLLKNAPL
jgi:chemosensory pili system protein ChpC